jgi:hypothetical protein
MTTRTDTRRYRLRFDGTTAATPEHVDQRIADLAADRGACRATCGVMHFDGAAFTLPVTLHFTRGR